MSTPTNSHSCEVGLTLSISPIVKTTTTSTPTSPGAASPSALRGLPLILDQLKVPAIEPPTRPKSTPFSWQETSNCDHATRTANGSDQPQSLTVKKDETTVENIDSSKKTFSGLPTEIHELILDHLFGTRASTANTSSTARGWSTALRHSRRRQLSDVALISRSYRELVQGRLFKHSQFVLLLVISPY